jgi:hypothetical protein
VKYSYAENAAKAENTRPIVISAVEIFGVLVVRRILQTGGARLTPQLLLLPQFIGALELGNTNPGPQQKI